MLRAGAIRFLLLAIVMLVACAPAAAACAPDSGPNLSHRVVTSAEIASYSSLECANFQHADLRGISFLQADLKTADFRFAIVTGDDFSQATLYDSNFYGAQAAHADFGQAMMQYANLHHANLQGADFIQTYLEHATLGGANTSGANFTQADTYKTTGLPSSSGSGALIVIILIVVALLIAVPILITTRRTKTPKAATRTPPRSAQASFAAFKSNDPRPASPREAAPGDDVTELAQLTALHQSGALTDEEFSAAKQKIIDAG